MNVALVSRLLASTRLRLVALVLSEIVVALTLAATTALAADAPGRPVPSPFTDTDAARSCFELIAEQGLDRDIPAKQAAVHACVTGRAQRYRAQYPERHPVHGRPETSRPK